MPTKKYSRREVSRVKKAIQAALPPLPEDPKAREEELKKRSSWFYRAGLKARGMNSGN